MHARQQRIDGFRAPGSGQPTQRAVLRNAVETGLLRRGGQQFIGSRGALGAECLVGARRGKIGEPTLHTRQHGVTHTRVTIVLGRHEHSRQHLRVLLRGHKVDQPFDGCFGVGVPSALAISQRTPQNGS